MLSGLMLRMQYTEEFPLLEKDEELYLRFLYPEEEKIEKIFIFPLDKIEETVHNISRKPFVLKNSPGFQYQGGTLLRVW